MHVTPYLHFGGRTEKALELYRRALGATAIELLRFKDAPEPPPPGAIPAGFESKVMHGTFRVGDTTIMVSDGADPRGPGFEGFGLTITVDRESEADRVFNALAEGGTVRMPLSKTFFSPRFGMLVDRFGVAWMVFTGA
jgi:PhnB protein